MKSRVAWFVFGILVGICLTVVAVLFFDVDLNFKKDNAKPSSYSGLTMAVSETELNRSFQYLKVLQAIDSTHALAYATNYPNDILNFNDLLVLLIGEGNTMFYDDLILNVELGKKLMQIGTYQYKTRDNITKTVPAVKIR